MKLMNQGSIAFSTLMRWLLGIAAVITAVSLTWAQGASKPAGSADEFSPGSPLLIEPQELLKAMKRGGEQPAVLYVGPKAFWVQAHIPGADYIGAVAKPDGLKNMQTRIAPIPKTMPVVVYCGCCPFEHCPNIRPAVAELKKEGFTKIRVLYLRTSFGVDWQAKGLPIATGE